jgi:hypothetical protein
MVLRMFYIKVEESLFLLLKGSCVPSVSLPRLEHILEASSAHLRS